MIIDSGDGVTAFIIAHAGEGSGLAYALLFAAVAFGFIEIFRMKVAGSAEAPARLEGLFQAFGQAIEIMLEANGEFRYRGGLTLRNGRQNEAHVTGVQVVSLGFFPRVARAKLVVPRSTLDEPLDREIIVPASATIHLAVLYRRRNWLRLELVKRAPSALAWLDYFSPGVTVRLEAQETWARTAVTLAKRSA